MPTAPLTLIVLNPHAAGGRAGRLWTQIEPMLWHELGDLLVAVTQHPNEVAAHLAEAHQVGIRRVIAIGGDGTNHALVNALVAFNAGQPAAERFVFGSLPVGTGRDWARGLGLPTHDLRACARWIAQAQPRPIDLGHVAYSGTEAGEYFLNIASVGLGGDVAARVNRVVRRRPWTFLAATVHSVLRFQPQPVRIALDGAPWYDDRAFLVAVANGTTFGHGMRIAPEAQPHDGLFDVVLVRDVARWRILSALRRVFDGSHLSHPAVQHARARQVTIEPLAQPSLHLELDGEAAHARALHFTLHPHALTLLA